MNLFRPRITDAHRIELPTREGRTRGFSMRTLDGADYGLRKVREDGWTAFETPLPQVIEGWMARHPGLFVDVGANSGFYALLALASDPANQVLAFEPDEPARRVLRDNARLNRTGARLTIDARALSYRAGAAALHIPRQEYGLLETSSSLEASFRESHAAVRRVRVARLDAVLHRPATCIKIDVEGHEAGVLRGAEAVLARDRPLVAAEVLSGADFAAFHSLLSKLEYRSGSLRIDGLVEQAAVAFDPFGWNHLLVPAERWAALAEVLDEAHLSITS